MADGGEDRMTVLVTGGAGYIGSHTVLELVNKGYRCVVVDNLSNSSEESLKRVGELTGHGDLIEFHKVDLLETDALRAVVEKCRPTTCVHFAGLKAVGESVKQPLEYYHNNITGTLSLLRVLGECGCLRVIFSSSATVYGSASPPYTEESQTGVGVSNPYGWTKSMLEQVLRDWCKATEGASVVLLRYFNPVGAHESGRIGEDPIGIPNNLMPFVLQVAVGRREVLTIFGDDYDTEDGSAERDYIHVVDLAVGHLKALEFLDRPATAPHSTHVFNLGTGTKHSVKQVLSAMEKAAGKPIPHVVGDRRPGDLPVVYAKVDKARDELGWTATRTLQDMCRDAWKWQSENPMGFRKKEDKATE